MTGRKVAVTVGPTGHGKSYLVKLYTVEGKQPDIGSTLESKTCETKPFLTSVDGEEVIMYDTPGLGDSQARDQIFLDELVQTLQKNCGGIHKFYFVMSVYEPRYGSYLQICLSTLLQLAPDIRQKPAVLTVVLTKADEATKLAWDETGTISTKIASLKQIIENKHQIKPEVILHGKGNQAQFIQDIKNARIDVFSQTQFMRNVQTLDTQCQKAREELEIAKKEAEEGKKRIDQLEAEYQKAAAAQDAKAQGLADEIKQLKEQDQKKVSELQAAYDKAAKDNEGQTKLLSNEISDLKTKIANMPQPIHNHYYSNGDAGGGSDCVLL